MIKRIVLINQVTGYLFIDIANAFCNEYDEVVLFAGVIKPMDMPLNKKVKLVKIMPYNKKNSLTRTISWVLGFVKSTILLKSKYRKYEVFASTNPPTLNFLPLSCKNKISLLVYDIYPDGLVAAGFVKNTNFINRYWEHLNRKSFQKLHTLTTLTPGMANLLSKYIDETKIKVIPAWSNQAFSKIKIVPQVNEFIQKYHLQNKFLVIYSGNLGKGNNLDSLVYLAESIREQDEILIIIIGEGFKKERLSQLIIKLNLSNILLLPYQPSDLFIHVLYAMNIGIVSLDPVASQIAIPSKIYNILGAGKPVICIGPKNSDLAEMIHQNNIGFTFSSDQVNLIKEFILKSLNDKDYYNMLCLNAKGTSTQFTYRNADQMVANHISQ